MTVSFTLATRTKVDYFRDSASINDVVKYELDCTPWQEDNSPITSVDVSNDGAGSAGLGVPTLVNGVVTFLATFAQAGWASIRIVLNTATQKKTVWLKTKVVDRSKQVAGDDYGFYG